MFEKALNVYPSSETKFEVHTVKKTRNFIPHRHDSEDSNGYFRPLTFHADFLGNS